MKRTIGSYIKNQSGFSVVELMVAVALVLFMGAAFYASFFGMSGQMWRQKLYMDNDLSAKSALDRISKDAKEAVGIVSSYNSNTTGTSVLILKLPSIDNGGVPTNIASQFDYVTYKLDNSSPARLTRTLDVLNGTSLREGGADVSNIIVSRNVQALQFTSGGTAFSSLSASALQALKRFNVQITTQGTTLSTTQQTILDSDIMLRNYIT